MFRTWSNVIRSLLIIINIISIVPGCLLMYVCFNFHRNSLSAANQSNPLLTYCCIIGEGLGLIIVLIAVLGLYGAIKRSKSTLLTYATILSIVVLLLVAMLVVTYTPLGHKNRLPDDLDKAIVNSTVAMYNYVDTTAPTTVLEDWIQKRFSCCGVNSPNDWTEYSYQKIPRSCCLEPVESSLPIFKYCAESDYRIGCWRPARDYFFDTVVPLTRDFILINIYFNVFCIALSGLLVRGIKKDLDVV